MTAAKKFTELQSWRKARAWSKAIFEKSLLPPFSKDQRLIVQINDSSESVMANIAEGFGRQTQEEFVTFLGYALGSLDETLSHLCAAYDRKYLTRDEFADLYSQGEEVRKMIIGFIRSMVLPKSGVRYLRPQKSWSEKVREIVERVTGKKFPDTPGVPRQADNSADEG